MPIMKCAIAKRAVSYLKSKTDELGQNFKCLKYITAAAIFTLFSWARHVLSKRGKLGIKVMLLGLLPHSACASSADFDCHFFVQYILISFSVLVEKVTQHCWSRVAFCHSCNANVIVWRRHFLARKFKVNFVCTVNIVNIELALMDWNSFQSCIF